MDRIFSLEQEIRSEVERILTAGVDDATWERVAGDPSLLHDYTVDDVTDLVERLRPEVELGPTHNVEAQYYAETVAAVRSLEPWLREIREQVLGSPDRLEHPHEVFRRLVPLMQAEGP